MSTTLVQGGGRSVAAERKLTPDEIRRRIKAAGWAVLAVLEGARPYAVPMAYGYDGRRFFVASGPGRKRRALEQQPLVCLTILDGPDDEGSGSYVVVLGRATPVSSWFTRLRAGLLILSRFSRGGIPSPSELRRMAQGRVFRIDPHEVAGRARTILRAHAS